MKEKRKFKDWLSELEVVAWARVGVELHNLPGWTCRAVARAAYATGTSPEGYLESLLEAVAGGESSELDAGFDPHYEIG